VTGQTKKPVRLAVVLSHPTQYYSPWFRWIRRHTSIELRVFYLWDFGVTPTLDPKFGKRFAWDVDLLSGYDSEFIPNISRKPGAEHFFGFNNPGLTRRLKEWRPDALLLFGYKYLSHIRTIAWARLSGVPLLFRGDSHLLGRGRLRPHVRLLLGTLFAQFAGFLYVGIANREYFLAAGVPATRLFFCPHCVDAERFDSAHSDHRVAAGQLRTELGLSPSARLVLFAGKFVPEKQPVELLRAFLKLDRKDTALVFVGDGPERAKMELVAREYEKGHGNAAIRFLPFANQSEMPTRLAMADVFALPSRGYYETWGLAVNEAMHMGVPCIVSDRVGCQRDLVTQGETGWVFPVEVTGALDVALGQAFDDMDSPEFLGKIRKAVRLRIEGYTYRQATGGLLAALATLGP
jgi:glycosyltransferase involved in cell wall biosynthesis